MLTPIVTARVPNYNAPLPSLHIALSHVGRLHYTFLFTILTAHPAKPSCHLRCALWRQGGNESEKRETRIESTERETDKSCVS